MRVTGGDFRGQRLLVPSGKIRPATDLMRESLFNILSARGVELIDKHFLDLFSGSGSMAIEAASRGAASITLVERDHRKKKCLQHNTRFVNGSVKIRITPCERFLRRAQPPPGGWDIVFMDPPYIYRHRSSLLAACLRKGVLNERSFIIIHFPVGEELKSCKGLSFVDGRNYGSAQLNIYRRSI